jgi:hypothetical protein
VELETASGFTGDPDRVLARLLKVAWRSFRFRCRGARLVQGIGAPEENAHDRS